MPIEVNNPTPQEKARIAKVVQSKEVAPSTRQQSAEYANWRAIADAPADPFNIERIPLSRLRQMRLDPMIGFALHFVKTPLIRAPWYIQCEDAQVAAFVDYCLRKIYSRLVLQYMLSLDFGFVAVAKKFVQEPILATYFDPNDTTDAPPAPSNFLLPPQQVSPSLQGKEKPVWSEGAVLPTIWAPFVPIRPEDVEPIYTNSGEFDGIKVTPTFAVQSKTKASNEGDTEIDVFQSLWITNDRDRMFGNIFGYPRIGGAFNYWWSYWHQHSLSDRHFEKDADPPTIVRHPIGRMTDPDTNEVVEYQDLALSIGDRVRAGSTIALPSDVYTGFEDRPTTIPRWDIDFLKGGGNFEAFISSFSYLNTMKLRAVWVPEQALIEGGGGTSSRNVAETFGDAFQESQAVLLGDFDNHINQFIIPQLLAINFPEFQGQAVKVTRGFSNKDVETMRQLVQLIGQTDISKLPLDTRQLLEDLGLPLMDPKNQLADAQAAAQQNAPGAIPAVAGKQAGVVPTPGTNAPAGNPSTNAPNLPFSYIQPPERISIPDFAISLADDFVASLPSTLHYEDRLMKQYAHQVWLTFRSLYKGQYEDFLSWIQTQELNLSDESVELAGPDFISRLVARWKGNNQLWIDTISKIKGIYRAALGRSGKLALQKHNLNASWSADDLEASEFINNQIGRLFGSVSRTISDDLTRVLTNELADMEEPSPEKLATALREHFADYPDWQAARVARTELRDIYNNGTLLAGQAAGIAKVQIVDGQHGPTDEMCEERDGDILSLVDAFKLDEHPNGTLAFRLLAADNLTIEPARNGVRGEYDVETQTIYLADDVDEESKRRFLLAVGDAIVNG